MTDNGYEIRLVGTEGDVTPEGLPLSELGEFLTQVEKLIVSDTQGAVLSLVSVRNKCVSLGLKSNLPLDARFELIAQCATAGSAETLDYKGRQAFNHIRGLLGKKALLAEFFKGETKLGVLIPVKEERNKNVIINCTASIYGELVKVGGKNPKATIEHRDGYAINCDIPSREVARTLASRLYTRIGVRGRGLRLVTTGRFTEFTIESLLPYEQIPIDKAFAILRNEFGSVFSKINPDEFVAELRGD